MSEKSLKSVFGNTAQLTVLENLIRNQGEVTYLSGIAAETGLSHSSVARVLDPLLQAGVVQEKLLGKQIRTFQLNRDNEAAQLIVDFYNKLVPMMP